MVKRANIHAIFAINEMKTVWFYINILIYYNYINYWHYFDFITLLSNVGIYSYNVTMWLWLRKGVIACLSCWMPMMWSMKMALDANCARQMEVLLPFEENTRLFVVSSTTALENMKCIILSLYMYIIEAPQFGERPIISLNVQAMRATNWSIYCLSEKYIFWNGLFST